MLIFGTIDNKILKAGLVDDPTFSVWSNPYGKFLDYLRFHSADPELVKIGTDPQPY